MGRVRWLSVAAFASLGAPLSSHAAGTPAGTSIQNTAQVSYSVGSSNLTATSNTSTVQVAERLDAVLTLASPTVQVSPGATAEELVFTLTNTGNGSERFHLTALSAGVVSAWSPDTGAPSTLSTRPSRVTLTRSSLSAAGTPSTAWRQRTSVTPSAAIRGATSPPRL